MSPDGAFLRPARCLQFRREGAEKVGGEAICGFGGEGMNSRNFLAPSSPSAFARFVRITTLLDSTYLQIGGGSEGRIWEKGMRMFVEHVATPPKKKKCVRLTCRFNVL